MGTPFWLVSLPTWSAAWSALRFAGPPGRRATFVGPTGQAKARDGQSNAMMFCGCVIFACRCVSFRLFRLKWIEDVGMKKHIQNNSGWFSFKEHLPGEEKWILEAWCTSTRKPSWILSMTASPAATSQRRAMSQGSMAVWQEETSCGIWFDLICTCGVTVLRCLLRLCASSAAGPCQIKDFFAAFESSPLNYSYIVEQEDRWAVETEAVRTLGHNLRKRQTLNFDIRLRCPFTSFTCADGGRKSMKAVGMDVTDVRWHTKTYWSCYKSKIDKHI